MRMMPTTVKAIDGQYIHPIEIDQGQIHVTHLLDIKVELSIV
jgi:hypothetical protein